MNQEIPDRREEVEYYDLPEDLSTQTLLQNRYVFWYHRRGKSVQTNYEDSMKIIGSFQTVEHFWRIYNHLTRPNEFKNTTDYHLFKEGIKPTWEDPANKQGGKWMVRLKKGLSSRYWEEIVLAVVGEQFDVGHEICGAVVSVRNNEDIISVWNKNSDNQEATIKIRDQIRRILKLPHFISIEYKKHSDSLTDKSSFRNPSIVWRASAAGRGERDNRGAGFRDDNINRPDFAGRGDVRDRDFVGGERDRERVGRVGSFYTPSPRPGDGDAGSHSYHSGFGHRDREGVTPKGGSGGGSGWKHVSSSRESVSTGDPIRDKEIADKEREKEREREKDREKERERPSPWGTRKESGDGWVTAGRPAPPGSGWGRPAVREVREGEGAGWYRNKGTGGTSTSTGPSASTTSGSPKTGSERKKLSQADAADVWSRGRALVVQPPTATTSTGSDKN